MQNERVINLSVDSGIIYGLLENGALAIFDKEIGHWVIRGSGEVKNIHGANIMKPTTETVAPTSKYSYSTLDIESDSEKELMLTLLIGASGLLALGVAMYYFFFSN